MTPPRLVRPIMAILSDYYLLFPIAWVIESTFAVTLPQALVISWLFCLILNTIKYPENH